MINSLFSFQAFWRKHCNLLRLMQDVFYGMKMHKWEKFSLEWNSDTSDCKAAQWVYLHYFIDAFQPLYVV